MGGRVNNMARALGILLLVLATAMMLPLMIALIYSEKAACAAFLFVIGICYLLGGYIRILIKPSPAKWRNRDGFLVVSLGWLICAFIGAIPIFWCGAAESFIDAFFESCSGFTTTGASVIADLESLPRSILFWRSFTSWLGGMGIIAIVMALMPHMGISGHIATQAEGTSSFKDKLTARFSDTTRNLYLLYTLFTLLQIGLLLLGGMDLFDASIHALGTISTGGFSNYNDGMLHFTSPYIQLITIIFMLIAGTNFNLFFLARRRGLQVFLKDEEFHFYITAAGVAALGVFLCNLFYQQFENPLEELVHALFQVTSIMTTTGMATIDYTLWPTFSQMVLLCLFFFGACASSAAGGIKCGRILLYLKLIRRSFSLRIHPHRVAQITLNGREVHTDTIIRSTNFLFTYIVVLMAGTLLIAINNFDFMTSFTAAASCLANIGPGLGAIGPAGTFAQFSDLTKLVCSVLMIMGRVDLVTFLTLFSRHYWNSNRP